MILALLILLTGVPVCPFDAPVDGRVARGFAPLGEYGGHWGVDLVAVPGSSVSAAAEGVVTFSGRVAGRLSVTVHHGGGVRTSYSYLATAGVKRGDRVERGEVIGTSGIDHGVAAVHYSVRIGDLYVAPLIGTCRLLPGRGVRLRGVPAASSYPLGRATRDSRRHIRPSASRPSDGR